MATPAQSVLNSKSEIVNRKLDKPAYKAAISPGPLKSHQSCPESQNVRRITYEFIRKLCKTNPIPKNTQIHVSPVRTMNYEQTTMNNAPKAKPKQTQSNPKQSQLLGQKRRPKPKRTQTNPIYAIGKQTQSKGAKNTMPFDAPTKKRIIPAFVTQPAKQAVQYEKSI